MGFTLTFYKGKMWDHINTSEDSIFRKSSIARVKLVLQIADQMKHSQKIKVCHGDLHLENILI